jgi:hypothetical protein
MSTLRLPEKTTCGSEGSKVSIHNSNHTPQLFIAENGKPLKSNAFGAATPAGMRALSLFESALSCYQFFLPECLRLRTPEPKLPLPDSAPRKNEKSAPEIRFVMLGVHLHFLIKEIAR